MRFGVVFTVAAAFSAVVPAVAAAQDWRLVGEARSHVTAMDFARVSGPETRRVAWFVRAYTERNELMGDYALLQYRFDCPGQTMVRLATATYDIDGQSRDSLPGVGEVETVFPETTGAAMFDAACGVDFPAEPTWGSARSFAEDVRDYTRSGR